MFELLPLNLSLSEKGGCISIQGVDFSVLLSPDEVALGLVKCPSYFSFYSYTVFIQQTIH